MASIKLLSLFLGALYLGAHHATTSDWIGQAEQAELLLSSSDGASLFTSFSNATREAVNKQTYSFGLLEMRQCRMSITAPVFPGIKSCRVGVELTL
jgi:hypothetical protein